MAAVENSNQPLTEHTDQDIIDVLEEGNEIATEQWNTVYSSETFMEDKVVKVFYGVAESEISQNIEGVENCRVPETYTRELDLSELDYEENAVVAVQEESDKSLIDGGIGPEEHFRATSLVDSFINQGIILSDFDIEEIHSFGGKDLYIDIEDRSAYEKANELASGKAREKTVDLYISMAEQLASHSGERIEKSKQRIASYSDMIENEAYEGSFSQALEPIYQNSKEDLSTDR